jgi:hypothetical protein
MNERKLTKSELAKREDIIMKMKKNKRSLTQKYGKDAEAVMYGRATNLAKKQAESMDQDKIKELVKDALQNPKKADLNKDGKLSDYEKKRGAAIEKSMANELDATEKAASDKIGRGEEFTDDDAAAVADKMPKIGKDKEFKLMGEAFLLDSDIEDIVNALGYSDVYHFFEDNPGAADAIMDWVESIPEFSKMLRDADLREDLDLGHQDDEPHMLKADLYRIGKYAMELYQMVDRFEEGSEEVDFPHWWQSRIIRAKDMLVGAKHYLDFEVKEPQIDAMVDVAAEEDVIDENAIGINDRRLDDKQKSALDLAVRGDSSYTFGNDPYADDQLRYKYAKKMGFLEEKEEIKEGVWSLGSANEIKDAIHTLEMWYELDARQISALFDDKDNSNFFYNIVGDDLFHDYLNRVETAAASDNTDRAHNNVGDAIGRAEELLAFVQKREGLNEEDPGEADMVASDIQKAMNKHKKDDAKMHQLQKARTAMNKGDLDKAKKIAARLAEKLKSK